MSRRRVFRLISLAIGALVLLSSAEGLTRLASPSIFDLASPFVRFDPQLGWVYRPGTSITRLNEAHQRVWIGASPLGIRQPADGYRLHGVENVLVVGDSLAAGAQVNFDDTWPAGLQERLRARHPTVQVVNGGVDAYDLCQEYWLAERLWARFQPRVLVVSLSIGRDLIDYERASPSRTPWRRGGLETWLWGHSYFYHLLLAIKTRGDPPPRALGMPPRQWKPASIPGFDHLRPDQQMRILTQFASSDLLPVITNAAQAERRLESTERMLEELLQLARSRCAGFALVLFPTKQQVIPSQRQEWMRLHHLSDEQVDLPQARLKRWGDRRGVLTLDMGEVLSKAPRPEELYWRVDVHLAPAGHALVAASLSPFVDSILERSVGCRPGGSSGG